MKDYLTIKHISEIDESEDETRFILNDINDANVDIKKSLKHIEKILAPKRMPFYEYYREDGILDSTMMTQIVSNPLKQEFYKQRKAGEIPESCITFMIDSMSFSSIENRNVILSIIDNVIKIFDSVNINSELYGFNGNNIIKYKKSSEKWQKSQKNIAKFLRQEPLEFYDWETVLKSIIIGQKKYFEENRILFFITNKAMDFNIYTYGLRNKIKYEHLNTQEAGNSNALKSLLIRKIALSFNLKSKYLKNI